MPAPRGVKHDEQGGISVGDSFHGVNGVDVYQGGGSRVFRPLLLRRGTLLLGRLRVQRIIQEREKVFLLSSAFVVFSNLAVVEVLESRKSLNAVRLADRIVLRAVHPSQSHLPVVAKFGRRGSEMRLEQRNQTK